MKISIIYHSESGNTRKVAEVIKETAEKVEGIEINAFDLDHIDKGFVEASKVIIFGSPTYYASMSWQMKKYLDTMDIKLAGKMGCAFATENFIGGGADFAELSIIGCLLVRGMIVYSGGAAETPYTHFGAVTIKAGDEPQVERVKKYAHKIVKKAKELFGD